MRRTDTHDSAVQHSAAADAAAPASAAAAAVAAPAAAAALLSMLLLLPQFRHNSLNAEVVRRCLISI